ncbi:hypothetical protein A5634_01560 [Mycobacterium asiaticum]|uniref:Uncharacterized protein n=1 Tax=Mycobacterium asiaticum TaxID=1790 RepID=A0A1A3P3E0_MYCAS|nr:hypothetical protein [Mycobacterium asiaticum]OBK27097.1 hypothetical protein A5634_01560 [Mycobacterium asiaticum]
MVNHQQRRELIRRQIQDPTAATPLTRRPAQAVGRTGAVVARAAKRLLPGVLFEEVRHVRHDLAKLGHARVATAGDWVRPRHYPPRSCSYLDDELMDREMLD